MTATDELEPCPFCGWNGIHMRKKTRLRESVTGLTYMRGYDRFDPYSLGFIDAEFHEEHCYDYRFGVRFYCGRCKAEVPYVWGEWHLPSEDDVETFDDLPHACERFSPDEERATIEKAIAAWNRRVTEYRKPTTLSRLEDENAKLRELAKKLVILAFARCADCDLLEASCALVSTQKCLLWNECESIARELGIEVSE